MCVDIHMLSVRREPNLFVIPIVRQIAILYIVSQSHTFCNKNSNSGVGIQFHRHHGSRAIPAAVNDNCFKQIPESSF